MKNFRHPIVILHGRHRDRVGKICGDPAQLNRHIAKVVVRFEDEPEWCTFDISNLGTPDDKQGDFGL